MIHYTTYGKNCINSFEEFGITIEQYNSLDLNGFNIRRANIKGIKMIINTDAHQKEQMDLMEYGVGQARIGWAEKIDIINTLSLEKLLKLLK